MSNEERAAKMTQGEIVSLLESHQTQARRLGQLQTQLDWFKRQLFGSKSERRVMPGESGQLTLGGMPDTDPAAVPSVDVPGHRRRKQTAAGDRSETELRFDDSVPVEQVILPADIPTEEQDEYEQIGEKKTRKLAQRPGSYVVLEYVRPVMKKKASAEATEDEIVCAAPPAMVLDRSFADVSLLAGVIVDKYLYHLPLHRQHQRMAAGGVRIARSSLTNWVHRCADLLTPVHEAQQKSILSSAVLAMDETPLKAGRKKNKPPDRGKMSTGYFWPLYGDRHEVIFHFAPGRAHSVVKEMLRGFEGTLLTDGYDAYEQFAAQRSSVRHAACWVHTRRYFDRALDTDRELAEDALARIGQLYDVERDLNRGALPPQPAKVLEQRAIRSKPVLESLFEWLREIQVRHALLPSSPLTKAVAYALEREDALKVFLEDPAVPLDTNHLEREIRPVAVGRKNWLFCWTEVGARYSGVLQGLLSTCRLQGVDPYTYLVDVLQRVQDHPASAVDELTPRVWKEKFAADPLRSDLDRVTRENVRSRRR